MCVTIVLHLIQYAAFYSIAIPECLQETAKPVEHAVALRCLALAVVASPCPIVPQGALQSAGKSLCMHYECNREKRLQTHCSS